MQRWSWIALALVVGAACSKGGGDKPSPTGSGTGTTATTGTTTTTTAAATDGATTTTTPPPATPAADARPATGHNPLANGQLAPNAPPNAPANAALALEPMAADAAAKFPTKGALEAAYRFTDAKGDNAIVIASSRSDHDDQITLRLWIDHYRAGPSGPVLVRDLKDLVEKCWGDATLALQATPEVTDLDGDGIAEITIVYRVGCRSDVSPLGIKVLLIEDGVKYALRGETHITMGDGSPDMGGTFTLDPASPPAVFAKQLRAAFDAHAEDTL